MRRLQRNRPFASSRRSWWGKGPLSEFSLAPNYFSTGRRSHSHGRSVAFISVDPRCRTSRRRGRAYAGVPMVRRCWKHSRQYTGRPCVGLKGTVVSFPHCEQVVLVSTRW